MVDEQALQEVIEYMDSLSKDTAFPRNVREAISKAKDELIKKDEPFDVRLSSAVYIIDDVSNDINVPMHARSELWNLVSMLEGLKGE
ncbi:MAG: UPF0147 family protein [Candidatus Diapherotrites archaeon]|nr:UPF0147 family protein [Candidatus Diapherotrites archaeon]